MAKQTIIINQREKGVVRLHRPRTPAEEAAAEAKRKRKRGKPQRPGAYVETPRTRIQFFDLYTHFYQIAWDARIGAFPVWPTYVRNPSAGLPEDQNGYIEYDAETIGNSATELLTQREQILANDQFGTSKASPSEREIANVWPLYQDCGNMFLNFELRRKEQAPELVRRYVLQNGNLEWQKVVSREARRENFESLAEYHSRPDAQAEFQGGLDRLKLAESEPWLSQQLALTVDQQGILIPRELPGQWDAALDSLFYYEPFHTADPVNYKYTSEPRFDAEEAPMPRVLFGGQSRDVKIYLVPQRWQVRFTYLAWYLAAGFLVFIYFPVVHTETFHNRFPLFPLPVKVSGWASEDLPRAWQWIERSHAHSRAVSTDYTIYNQSQGVFQIQFQFTSSGRFEIRRTDSFAKTLAAVVDFNGERRYIWRKTGTNRDLTTVIMDGPLETFHIKSWFLYTVGVSGGNMVVFPR